MSHRGRRGRGISRWRLARVGGLTALVGATILVVPSPAAAAAAPAGASAAGASAPGASAPAGASAAGGVGYGQLPMSFEANLGQTDGRVLFLARGQGYGLFVNRLGATLALQPSQTSPGAALAVVPVGGNPAAKTVGLQPLAGRVNYLEGRNPTGWHTNVATYAAVAQRGVFPGVDLVYHGAAGRLEYDVVVAPRTNPASVRLRVDGTAALHLGDGGDLIADSAAGPVVQQRPVAYQDVAGGRRFVKVDYVLDQGIVRFRTGAYDRTRPLVIDPVLLYGSYLGGSGDDAANKVAVDPSGAAYVVGTTASADFPTTLGALDRSADGDKDVFVTKLNPSGTAEAYSTYVGGGSMDLGTGIAIDATGAAYIAGFTQSADFPTTPGAPKVAFGSDSLDAFVAKLTPGGAALAYSTYGAPMTRTDEGGMAITVDGTGAAYVTGGAAYPTYVVKVSPDGSQIAQSAAAATILSGPRKCCTSPFDLTLGPDGSVYLTGHGGPSQQYSSSDFVAKLDPTMATLDYFTTFSGGGFLDGQAIVVDATGAAYITGETQGINGYPPPPDATFVYGFLTKIAPDGSVDYLTYMPHGIGYDIVLDGAGNPWVTGTNDPAFVTTPDALPGSGSGYVARFDTAGAIAYATKFGGSGSTDPTGIAIDGNGSVYVTGSTSSVDFPTTAGAVGTGLVGGYDAFIIKLGAGTPPPPPPPPPPFPGNHLDADTSDMEPSIGQWVPWFSTSLSQSSARAHSGADSLKVDITAPDGWGITLHNWPGFAATPGTKFISFWGQAPSQPGPLQSGLGATMTVTWRNANAVVLQTDTVSVTNLGDAWSPGGSVVNAPSGTAFVAVDFSNATGQAGNTVYLDDVVVAAVHNALDAPTSSLESSVGQWTAWYSTTVARSAKSAHSGTHSLKVDVNAAGGWGVTQRNSPGFAATPGPKTLSFAAEAPLNSPVAVSMTATWRDVNRTVLGTETLSLPDPGPTWRQVSSAVTAPPGTAFASVDFSSSVGNPGNSFYLDDIAVVDGTVAVPTPPAPANNALDPDTATIERSQGQWVPWYSCTILRTAPGHLSSAGLIVEMTAPTGWGVTLHNYPGFATDAGPKTISFWTRTYDNQDGLGATMRVEWRDASGSLLGTNEVSTASTTLVWQQATANVVAPNGTARVNVDFYGATPDPGRSLFLDDIVVADR